MMPRPGPPLYPAPMKTFLFAPHVALVEDDLDVREGLQALLRSFGYRVFPYEDAQQFFDAGHGGIDCVLSDVQMPGMDGFDLLARLRADRQGPPCVLMTAFPDAHVRARALRGGAAGFLGKPIDAEELAACIVQAMNG